MRYLLGGVLVIVLTCAQGCGLAAMYACQKSTTCTEYLKPPPAEQARR